jgi:hypothetical protein
MRSPEQTRAQQHRSQIEGPCHHGIESERIAIPMRCKEDIHTDQSRQRQDKLSHSTRRSKEKQARRDWHAVIRMADFEAEQKDT